MPRTSPRISPAPCRYNSSGCLLASGTKASAFELSQQLSLVDLQLCQQTNGTQCTHLVRVRILQFPHVGWLAFCRAGYLIRKHGRRIWQKCPKQSSEGRVTAKGSLLLVSPASTDSPGNAEVTRNRTAKPTASTHWQEHRLPLKQDRLVTQGSQGSQPHRTKACKPAVLTLATA